MTMTQMRCIQILLCLFLTSCFANQKPTTSQILQTKLEEVNLFDNTRARPVPVALYSPSNNENSRNQKLVVISHGYGGNKGKSNLDYSYLAENLASKGYFVVSVQHELATDSLLPLTGIPQIVRRTNWERGVANILFVINELKRMRPALDYKHVTLIGHSNGGDITMLFAQKYPSLVEKVISLDSRRVVFPRTKRPKVYSLRSNDYSADKDVLPTSTEQAKYGITIIKLANTGHSDMDDSGKKEQKEEINNYILGFINDN